MSKYFLDLPPFIVTAVHIGLLFIPLEDGQALEFSSSAWLVVVTSAPIMFVVAWALSLYVQANGRTDTLPRLSWLFVITLFLIPLLFTVVAVTRSPASIDGGILERAVRPLGFVTVACCFLCSWFAARALHRFEGETAVWRVFGTFLLITYLVIGIWFLSDRTDKVLSA